jgi:DNA primase
MQNGAVEEIKSRLNIVDVVSTYIKLEKSGSQFKARCPFHGEKTPSFYISPHKGYFHCFGCGVHGDIFTFITKVENVEFKDALKLLAERAGVSLQKFRNEGESKSYDILEAATRFFQNNLEQNLEAKQYLYGRGLEQKTIESFRVGFALADWRTLYYFLQKQNFSDKEIEESGLCIKHEKGFYDRFRSRIMFPICNSTGKVVAFTGRIIGPESNKEGVAKYVNSPETSVYHKSSILFAYDKARNAIAQEKKAILVEGQMDAVMSHQAGVTNVVAISGTALTQEHIKIITRFADTLVLSLDSDKAGFVAMLKSAQVAYFQDMFVEVIELGDAKDPADIVADDPIHWRELSQTTQPFFEYLANHVKDNSKDQVEVLKRVRGELLPVLKLVKSDLARDMYAGNVAEILQIAKQSILKDLGQTQIEENIQIREKIKPKTEKSLSELYTEMITCIDVVSTLESDLNTENIKLKTQRIKEILEKVSVEVVKDESLYDMRYVQVEQGMQKDFVAIVDVDKRRVAYQEVLQVLFNRLLQKVLQSTDNIEALSQLMKLK